MVLPGSIDGRALAVGVFWQETLADGGTALQGEAQLAPITEAVDNVVAVDGALWKKCCVNICVLFLFAAVRIMRTRTHVVVGAVGRHFELL